MKEFAKKYWALFIPLGVLITALIFLLKSNKSEAESVIGMVEASYTDVAAELPGRLDSLLVEVGDTVKKGQLIAVLGSTKIGAVNQQAQAAIDAAKSQLALLQKGTRPELIKSADNLYKMAQDQYKLAETTYQRMENLYKDQAVSGQERDMMLFKFEASKKELDNAKLNLEMLKKGSQPEAIQSAQAIVKQAESGYALTQSLTGSTFIHAPADGIISTKVINEGEVVAMGYPMITIQKMNSCFVRFNIRQDKINKLPVGTQVKLNVAGVEPENFEAKVSNVSPALEYANWVPTKERGQYELRTFTIECKPLNLPSLKGLRPGMTATLTLP